MKFLYVVFAALFVIHPASANTALVRCDISSFSDAKKCMAKEGEAQESGEEPNTTLVTRENGNLVELLAALGADSKKIRAAAEADYTAALIYHTSEHEVFYYAISKGKNVKPVILHTINVSDIGFHLTHSDHTLPEPDTFLLGHYAADYDIHEYIVEGIKEARENRKDKDVE